jgi:glutathione synthase/RimK-type ligase-like ATP-grasp enzyme
MTAGFTTSADITGPGTCKNYWTSNDGQWTKVTSTAQSFHIFDKISPVSPARTAERQLLLSDPTIIPFNDAELFLTFCDKLRTFKKLPEYAIPTVGFSANSHKAIVAAITKLHKLVAKARFTEDFSKKYVLKDRFGAGGNHVYQITTGFAKAIHTIMAQNPTIEFVLQPFLLFDQGFEHNGLRASTDIRLLFHHNQLIQCYLRMAKTDDFRCNEHQGGQLVYIATSDVSVVIHAIAEKIVKKINKPQALFALDFAVSNAGRIYLVEGNITPGIDWDVTKVVNEKKSKQLIRRIVKEFAVRKKFPLFD